MAVVKWLASAPRVNFVHVYHTETYKKKVSGVMI